MNGHEGFSRRRVLGMALAAGGFAMSGVGAVFAETLQRTPGEILGPFYPVIKRVEQGADLTTIPGRQGRATGQVIHVWDIVVDKG